ncbi:cytochrome c1 [Zooshikella marina]|uniref:Cytochrome c1 n=1 Tax=Zooshikella ganghwensis TaxID=202772 RepID=A0A4P9VPL0_9GAMM|nr:cytochrome c1 [Zooshikella ganghwensis]MBU2707334.1 cytochrome c1 [Zooshikella ganghwensis]RDH45438.1 cytochrome c1 [Zooshikella ganghwensis]
MKKQLIALLLAWMPVAVMAAGGSGYPLTHVDINLEDKAALQEGAKLYINYCMGCHSTEFQRYERVADDLGIPHELFMDNLVFDDAKIGDLMENAMRDDEAKLWFGAAPPDLTLVARVRGTDWLYTYLNTFYVDPKRPWGVNNKVFPDVAMPHVLAELQGLQEDTCGDTDPSTRDTLTGERMCGFKPITGKEGSMSEQEYKEATKNLVTFLAYAGEPAQLERKRVGVYVLLFLAVFFVFAYLLKREFWKDVH